MSKIIIAIAVSMFTLGLSGLPRESLCNEDILNQFVTIEGTVQTTEPETGRVFTPVGQALIFQRADCKRCLYVATTDHAGHYQLRAGEGKYRIIMPESVRGGSSLHPKQETLLNAKRTPMQIVFDVHLIRHKTELDMKVNE